MKTIFKKTAGFAIATGIAASAMGLAASVQAQTYPTRSVTVVFPYPPGTADLALRGLLVGVEKIFGQSVVVDYRTGGNEVPAMQAALNAAADGYTIAAPSQNFDLNPSVQKLSYTQSQFTPITQFAAFPTPFLIRADFPAQTFPEFLAYAKANPGKINIASVGPLHKVAWTLLEQKAGIKITQVPYRGGPETVQAILGGQIDALAINLQISQGLAKDGKVRMAASTGTKRMSQIPNVPTVAEFVPTWSLVYWQGLVAKAGTPRAAIDRWASAVREAHKMPEVIKVFQTVGYDQMSQTPEEMAAYIKNETESFAAAAKAAGIVPE